MKKNILSALIVLIVMTASLAHAQNNYDIVSRLSTVEESLKSGSYKIQNDRVVKSDAYTFIFPSVLYSSLKKRYRVSYRISSLKEAVKTKSGTPANLCSPIGEDSSYYLTNLDYIKINPHCGGYLAKTRVKLEQSHYNSTKQKAVIIVEFFKNGLNQKIPDHIIVTHKKVDDYSYSDDAGNKSVQVSNVVIKNTFADNITSEKEKKLHSLASIDPKNYMNLEFRKGIQDLEDLYLKENKSQSIGIIVSVQDIRENFGAGSFHLAKYEDQNILNHSETEINPTVYKVLTGPDPEDFHYRVALQFKTTDAEKKTDAENCQTTSFTFEKLEGTYNFKCGTRVGTLYIRPAKKKEKAAMLVEVRKVEENVPTDIFVSVADIEIKDAIPTNTEPTKQKTLQQIHDENEQKIRN